MGAAERVTIYIYNIYMYVYIYLYGNSTILQLLDACAVTLGTLTASEGPHFWWALLVNSAEVRLPASQDPVMGPEAVPDHIPPTPIKDQIRLYEGLSAAYAGLL